MGFSVKERDMHKLALFSLQKSHTKRGSKAKKVGQQFFDIKIRDCPSKIGTAGEYGNSYRLTLAVLFLHMAITL